METADRLRAGRDLERYEEWESRLHLTNRERVLGAVHDYLEGCAPEYALEFRLRSGEDSRRSTASRSGSTLASSPEALRTISTTFSSSSTATRTGSERTCRRTIWRSRNSRKSALTRELLAFSRRQVLQPQVLDLNDVVLQMQQLLTRVLGNDVTLQLGLSATARVTADRGQLERVLMNLAVNARDAMPAGGRFAIATDDVDLDPGPHVGLTVSVHSEPGQGSTFRIYLPAAPTL